MAQKDRTKEIWLIPKRVNLHQTICLIDGIIERKYDGTSWNPQKQNNLGVNLKKWGATNDGKNISPQAIRTLVASIPQYLGFVYINTDTTPNTICLTEAGMALWKNHKEELVKVPNLRAEKDYLITEAEEVLFQMEKLQITNPIIQKDCENIYVFPFRFMLRVLLEVSYLDKEEIAYFLFKVRNEDEIDVIVQEILNFRKLNLASRKSLIDAFKKTHIGNITLVKAPSSGYYMSLCQITGIIDRLDIEPNNVEGSLSAIKINDKYIPYVNEMLNKKYNKAEVYDFADNLKLWIDYIGKPDRMYPPININVHNSTNHSYLIQIFKDGKCEFDDLLEQEDIQQYPMFVEEDYNLKIIDVETGQELSEVTIIPSFEKRDFEIHVENEKDTEYVESIEEISNQINEHCLATNFAEKTLNYLNTLSKVTGIDKTTDKSLRGAYLEYYFYKLITKLKENNIVDDVIWNGRIGKYGLPVSAPGGKTGTPDLVFIIGDRHIVLELTTIRPKALQFSAEGSSVPDHIRLYRDNTDNNVMGIFCAPVIHERNEAAMLSTIATYGIKLKCITNEELVKILKESQREELIRWLD